MNLRRPWTLAEIEARLRAQGVSVEIRGASDAAISGITEDSRLARSGSLFLAWKGTRCDGHDFAAEAVQRGASALLCEQWIEGISVPQLRTPDPRRAGAFLAMALFGDPATALWTAAVTGTNGKTTTAGIVRHLLAEAQSTAVIGTLGVVGPEGRVREGTGGLTTPPPVELAAHLSDLLREGVQAVVLEASSHALDQRRLDGFRFNAAAFTNLTPDHLDYHGTMGAYRAAKSRLLELLAPGAEVTIFSGEPAWLDLPPIHAPVRAVGILEEGDAPDGPFSLPAPSALSRCPDLWAASLTLTGDGARFMLCEGQERVHVHLPLLGRFNVENALCAAGIARSAGLSLATIATRLGTAPAPKGRLEVTAQIPAPVILDYAHTPDALSRALETLRPLYQGRLIVVFGAGGDRDATKRPLMGQAALRGADLAIVTSDNPRTEDPDAIVDDILRGMSDGAGRFERITDRRQAIHRALELAGPNDAVLLAGKGHETVQIVGDTRRPFDEREIVQAWITQTRHSS